MRTKLGAETGGPEVGHEIRRGRSLVAVNVHARNVHLDRSFKDGLAAKIDHATRFLGGSIGEVDLEVT
ncbi:MAG TPA: hypothetical protein VHM94_06310, partial [Acidimicrobiia bacterium]|nr:hypothetical protein [Acidimicrobiia bacterium]